MKLDHKLLLKLGPSLMMILFGIDQIINPEVWLPFIPSWLLQISPLSPTAIMRSHALINVILGFLLLSGWRDTTVIWVTILWFVSIIPFTLIVDWTIAVRDFAVLLGLIALLQVY